MLILPDTTAGSRKLLDDAIADPFRITMLVLGDGHGEDVIASKADVRAQALASTRRVVWIRDPNLLTSAERKKYMKDDAVACVLNLRDEPVVWLSRSDDIDLPELEIAFQEGQAG
ncbi:MAG TPA: hypothetical protein VEK83_12530 [Gemmatimonadales bacterium]|nr:hypothetical protein [Gemmatimonadales bacterium]